MDPEQLDDYDSSDDEDYIPQETVEEDERDDHPYDDVDEDIVKEQSLKKDDNQNTKEVDNEDEKRRIDLLWADFLDGDAPVSTASPTPSTMLNRVDDVTPSASSSSKANVSLDNRDHKQEVVTDIFNFAGETVEVQRVVNTGKNECNGDNTGSNAVKRGSVKRSGGLANAAALLSKKKKMTVLDKTNHDWKTFVANEGIEADLKSHNRSKESYLDKQDFLLKADYSQFEKEKTLRQVERSKKK